VAPGAFEGVVAAPASKSVSHRALLLAAHSPTPCTLRNYLPAADPRSTLAGLAALGAIVEPLPPVAGEAGGAVRLHNAGWRAPREAIDCGNSGTTLRLLLGLVARLSDAVTLTGDASLRARPNRPLLDALRAGGARVDGEHAPITLRGPVRAGDYHLPAGVSSQFASSLMLSLPFLPGDSHLHLAAPVSSRPYLDVTRRVAAAFGIHTAGGAIAGGQAVRCSEYRVEGDWSGAAFPFVAAALGGKVTVTGLDAASPQGDRAILDVLRSFGARVHGTTVEAAPLASPGHVDVADTPDLFPALCVLAAAARGVTTFTGGAALRHKESNRIAAMATGLWQLGITCHERPDGLVVQGGRLGGGRVDARGDHRIHMAFAVAGLAAEGPVTVTDAESTEVSYPGFHAMLQVVA